MEKPPLIPSDGVYTDLVLSNDLQVFGTTYLDEINVKNLLVTSSATFYGTVNFLSAVYGPFADFNEIYVDTLHVSSLFGAGGTNKQIQYNNNGTFAGASITFDTNNNISNYNITNIGVGTTSLVRFTSLNNDIYLLNESLNNVSIISNDIYNNDIIIVTNNTFDRGTSINNYNNKIFITNYNSNSLNKYNNELLLEDTLNINDPINMSVTSNSGFILYNSDSIGQVNLDTMILVNTLSSGPYLNGANNITSTSSYSYVSSNTFLTIVDNLSFEIVSSLVINDISYIYYLNNLIYGTLLNGIVIIDVSDVFNPIQINYVTNSLLNEPNFIIINNDIIYVSSYDNNLVLLNINTFAVINNINNHLYGPLSFYIEDNYIFVGNYDSTISKFIMDTGTLNIPCITNITEVVNTNKEINSTSYINSKDSWKTSVKIISTSNITINSTILGSTVDGYILQLYDRILLNGQTTTSENGIYIVPNTGSIIRSNDALIGFPSTGTGIYVTTGSSINTLWFCSLGSTYGSSLSFTEFTGSGTLPGGSSNNIQFNGGGIFSGSNNFTWDSMSNIFTVSGSSFFYGPLSATSISVTSLSSSNISTGTLFVSGPSTFTGSISATSISVTSLSSSNISTGTLFVTGPSTFTGSISATSISVTSLSSSNISTGTLFVSGPSTFTGPVTVTSVSVTQISVGTLSATGPIYFTSLSIFSGNALCIDSSTGQVYDSVSLRSYKTNERIYDSDDILLLEPKLFTWIHNNKEELGLVVEDALDKGLDKYVYFSDDGPRNYRDRSLIAGLISVVKKQQKQIDELFELVNNFSK